MSVLCRREGVRHLGYLKFRPVLNYYFDLVLLYFGLVLTIDPSPNTLDDLDLDLSKMTDGVIGRAISSYFCSKAVRSALMSLANLIS